MTRFNGPDNQPPATWGDTYNNPMSAPIYPKKRKVWPWVVGILVGLVILGCGIGALALGSAANQAGKALETVTVPATGTPHGPAQKAGKVAPPAKAVETTKPLSAEQVNANRAAYGYLANQSFSRKGLIKQLEFEGYGTKAAMVAVDSFDTNWNEQAVLTAKRYLENQSFSKKSLTSQLEFEGFTPAQAKYGVSKTGL